MLVLSSIVVSNYSWRTPWINWLMAMYLCFFHYDVKLNKKQKTLENKNPWIIIPNQSSSLRTIITFKTSRTWLHRKHQMKNIDHHHPHFSSTSWPLIVTSFFVLCRRATRGESTYMSGWSIAHSENILLVPLILLLKKNISTSILLKKYVAHLKNICLNWNS